MKRGVWFQYGSGSQKIMLDLAKTGVGQGAVFSPRDISQNSMITNAKKLKKLGFELMIDQQYHIPSYSNKNLQSYSMNNHRNRISKLVEIDSDGLLSLQRDLLFINEKVGTNAVIAPAVIYEASDDKITDLNEKLFKAAKQVGDNLGIPTYASIIIGRSAVISDSNIMALLSDITRLNADGWYFSFEFSDEKMPSNPDEIYSFLKAGLLLANTGKPLFHAFAGPLGLLSYAFGSTAVGVGQIKNLWQFTRSRWVVRTTKFIPKKHPPKFFSYPLWGNIVHPDETGNLIPILRSKILEYSPYSEQVEKEIDNWPSPYPKKHLLYILSKQIEEIASKNNIRESAIYAIKKLNQSQKIQEEIINSYITIRDPLLKVQKNWLRGLNKYVQDMNDEFDYLGFLK
ncbi:hypothetical protein [Herpetosiphon giganteus]|uniref:hypothetical protein n=1 Tax=Herpetosiphon giganteus TaxID=2029754 RepID=UPI00195676FE|nr:hypothetical protein [Herpetosiphon giganteus]MBM7845370.1 hypothetical protein [Herpetosiphon giganteus]